MQERQEALPLPDPLEGWCVCLGGHSQLRPVVTEMWGPAVSTSSSGSESVGAEAQRVGDRDGNGWLVRGLTSTRDDQQGQHRPFPGQPQMREGLKDLRVRLAFPDPPSPTASGG